MPCFSQFVAICSYNTASPELAGNFNTKNSRRQRPATMAANGLEKIRFMNGTHLTMEQTDSGSRSVIRLGFQAPPCCQVERFHEGTWSNFLRRRARPVAAHAPFHGNFRRAAHAIARLFLREHRRQRLAPSWTASGHPSDLSRP